MRRCVSILLTALSFLTACSSSDENSSEELESTNVEDLGFFERESQHVAERTVRSQLLPSDSLLLSSDLEIYQVSHLLLEDEKLYIVDGSQLRIVALDPERLQEERTIEIPEGEGPGELPQIGNFDVQGDQIMLGSRSLQRIQYRDLDGELVDEFSVDLYPKEFFLKSNGNVIGLESPLMSDSDEVIHIMTLDGAVESSFQSIQDGRDMFTDLKIRGQLALGDDDRLYYGGFGEHLLKGWDAEGNLIFSVETIEPAPDNINYNIMEGSERRAAGYSEFGDFSVQELIATQDDLVVVHAGMSSFSAPDQPQYLDFYDPDSGIYSHTLELPYRTSRIAIHGNTLYASHMVEDEIYLFRYAME